MRLFISLWFVVVCFGCLSALGYGNDEDAVTINNKAVEYIESGLLDEALVLLEKAYGENGDDKVIRDNLVNAYNMRAKEYERIGNYDLCVGEYRKVLSRFGGDELTLKNFVTSLNNIGVRYNDRNEYTESLKYFQLAMNLLREFKDTELSKVVAVNYAGLLNKLAYEDYLNQDKVSAVGRLKRSLKLWRWPIGTFSRFLQKDPPEWQIYVRNCHGLQMYGLVFQLRHLITYIVFIISS